MSSTRSLEGCPFMNNSFDDSPSPAVGQPLKATPTKQTSSTSSNLGASPTPQTILGFASADRKFFDVNQGVPSSTDAGGRKEPCHYSSYLATQELHSLQAGQAHSKPEGHGMMHHEELTFIIVHQVFELWFKLVIADLSKAREFMTDITTVTEIVGHQRIAQCISFLRRTDAIFQHVLGAFTVIETMHPGDFLEFRDYLVPASGFQSVGFRQLEQLLGVQNEGRAKVNGAQVFTYLKKSEQDLLKDAHKELSLNEYITKILSQVRVPANFESEYLKYVEKVLRVQQYDIAKCAPDDPRAETLIAKGLDSVRSMLEDPIAWSDGLFIDEEDVEGRAQYKKAIMGALFVISYRNEPRFALLASLCDEFIAVEEGLVLWRGRHMSMAERMIGRRSGSGGTKSGVGYLDLTRRYRIFHCLWLVRKMFIRSSALPKLSSWGIDDKTVFFEPEELEAQQAAEKK